VSHEDEQGFVIYRDAGGKIQAYPMNRGADGAWKLSLLGPTQIR
jgi:hypothetical protein